MNELVVHAWTRPNTHYWFMSPIYSQAKDQYRKLTKYLPDEAIAKRSETELRVELINGSSIEYKSGEVLDRLRGATIHGVVLDEVRDLPSELWPLVIRPMLTTTQGWAAFISTPNGFDAFYDLFKNAESDPSWQSFQSPSTANPLFTQAEFEASRRSMSEAEFAQEILAEFRDLHKGKAYLTFSKDNLSLTCPFLDGDRLYSPHLPVILACDFNISPMAWNLGQQRGNKFYFFDSIFLRNSHTPEASEEIAQKIKALNIKHSPQVIIAGDATSKASQRAAAGASDYMILCQTLDRHGISWSNVTPDSNPSVKDRVNRVNTKLKSASGEITLWLHPTNCAEAVKDFERVSWKPGGSFTLDQTTDTERTHASDGIGYSVCALDPMQLDGSVGKLAIVRR